MKFYLVDGEVRFLTHKVEWQERDRHQEREFYDPAKKDAFVTRLQERDIEYTVTPYDMPSQEVLDKVAGRKFNTIAEAQDFIDNGEKLDEITELQLAMVELYEFVIGGGANG